MGESQVVGLLRGWISLRETHQSGAWLARAVIFWVRRNMANRPLSPHLQVYKWGPHMAASIFHRVTGSAMSFAALPALLWWLGALASGPEAYATFTMVATSWIGYIVLVGISWTFFHHSVSGVRHFILDMGAGFELNTNRAGSVATFAIALVLTAAFWAAMLL